MRIKDRLYIETDNACPACGVRNIRVLTIHHIDGNSTNNEYENQIVLCYNCHTLHHQRKGLTKKEITELKRRLILKTITQFGLNALKTADRSGSVFGAPYILNHLVGLGYLKLVRISQLRALSGGNANVTEAAYEITSKGSELLKRWRL